MGGVLILIRRGNVDTKKHQECSSTEDRLSEDTLRKQPSARREASKETKSVNT